MNALDVLCAQVMRDLFAIAKFLLTIGRLLLHCCTALVDMWRLVHQWSFLCCFDCLWRTVHCTNRQKHSKPLVYQSSQVYQDCTNSVPTVYQSSKTVKRQSKQQKSPLVYQSSHVYTESAEYTKPRKRRYLAKPASHVHGQWPQPVGRGQGWLYVSTWTSMRLAPVRCRVLLHSVLSTDDACSSSSLSDPTRKLSALPPELRKIR